MNARQISRRGLLTGSAAAAGMSALAGTAFARNAERSRGKLPNILFILADDMGYADLGCYGRTDYATPAIDRIAREGMLFRQAYANSAVCSASRTALITGRYQNRLPVGLEEPLGRRVRGLPPSHPTMPSLLRSQGYDTTLIGKWHLGQLPKYGPLQSGYDHFWGLRGGGIDYFSHDFNGAPDLWEDDREIEQPGYMTDLLAERAMTAIDDYAARQQPFFMSLHFTAPHWPWEGPDDQTESQRLAASDKPFSMFDTDGGSRKTYAEMVTRMDMEIGRILERLDRLGLAEDTIIVFTSDNGGERFSKTWPYNGLKTELLEGGLRVPAVMRWPRRIAAGQESEQVIMSMDWMPTFLSLIQASPDPHYPMDGMDLSATLLDGAAPVPRTLCWRYLNLSQEACRSGDWKYLKILDRTFLFNLVDDPQERANLKDRYPQIYAKLVDDYRKWDAAMLPLDFEASTSGFSGEDLADHFGVSERRMVETK